MIDHTLIDTARALVADQKGILAMDESTKTRHKRFTAAGILPTVDARRAGRDAHKQASVMAVTQATLTCLLRTVPAAVPGIVFLSGGQRAEDASARLNEMNIPFRRAPLPWEVSFPFGRALQQPALEIWQGRPSNAAAAQQALAHRAACNAAARQGLYDAATEQTAA